MPLTDGTYFINRWFAKVELIPKTVVPIGYVGVVVSYYGREGQDVSGDAFRHGERVAEGERGVWEQPLGPGKYPFNTYAGSIVLVPTTNFVLHWITGKSEAHRYDESLRSIDLVTKDAYEPLLPLSVVVHIDYQRAPSVIQRFGDVKKLITQTLDPMLSAYFRDVAHKKTMLELLHERDTIQAEARQELRSDSSEFDIECVDVLIGKPDTAEAGGKIETLLEQLRQRQLSFEQLETYERQRAAAEKLRIAQRSPGAANKQTELTNSPVQMQIPRNKAKPTWPGPASRPSRWWSSRTANCRVRAARPSRRWCWPKPTPGSANWPAAAKRSGSPMSVCPRRQCCCSKIALVSRSALVRHVAVGRAIVQEHAAAGAQSAVFVTGSAGGDSASTARGVRRPGYWACWSACSFPRSRAFSPIRPTRHRRIQSLRRANDPASDRLGSEPGRPSRRKAEKAIRSERRITRRKPLSSRRHARRGAKRA